MNCIPQHHTIECADGIRISLRTHEADSPKAIVIIAAAAAVKQTYYGGFSAYLVENGLTAVTFDYRGIGASTVARGAGQRVRMSDWGTLDLDAVIEWVNDTYQRPIHFIGHSIGAHLICLAKSNKYIRRAVLIGAQSGGLRYVHPRNKLPAAVFAYALGPALARLFDTFPAKKLGLGEDTPSGAIRQLAAWSRSTNWMFGDIGKDLPDHRASLTAETTLLVFSDEGLVTINGSRQFAIDA